MDEELDPGFDCFDLPIVERDLPISHVRRQPSPEETRDRYAFLKTKTYGAVWNEGPWTFKRTANGVTAFRFDA
jgi:hypothetical protein